MSKKIFKLSLIVAVLAVLVSGCTLPWKKAATNTNPINSVAPTSAETSSYTKQLKKFESDDELKKFLKENSAGNQGYGSGIIRGLAANVASDEMTLTAEAVSNEVSLESSLNSTSADSSASAVSPGSSATPDYSSTNNQVVGVDEADIIKTDGTYIYALVKNDLKIIKANPATEATVISTITFQSRPQDIFIKGTSLAVFGSDQQIYALGAYKSWRRQNPYTFFKVYDLSDISNPKLVRDLDFEGSYNEARLIGDYAYLFTNSSAGYIEGEPLVPRVLDGGTVLAASCEANSKCFAPDVYYFDIPYDSYNFSNVTAININDNSEAISGQTYLMDYGQNIYVSQNNVYLTYTEYFSEYELEQTVIRKLIFPQLSADSQNNIAEIEAAPNYILSASEKRMKVAAIMETYIENLSADEQIALIASLEEKFKQKLTEQAANLEKTVIYKIAIDGRNIEYRSSGEVSGQVLNQFSMDENGDYFRIATTRSSIWSNLLDESTASSNNIYVLDKELKVVGSLENLALSERIYAARFMGDRLYLVTFKQTDPLYVIGLSDPTKPEVLGAIKVPGFSNYLHPVDKNGNKLIGIGRDTESDSAGNVIVKGLKIALFDFTDLTKPQELDSYLIGEAGSDSIALQDHKAFLYSEEKNLLSLPAVIRENNKLTFAGALIFGITSDKLVLKGQIDHSGGGASADADRWNGYDYYDNTVKRSLYINDDLFTFSNRFLKINSLNDLRAIKSLILTEAAKDYSVILPTEPTSIPTEEPVASSTTPIDGIILPLGTSTSEISPEMGTSTGEIIPSNSEAGTSTTP